MRNKAEEKKKSSGVRTRRRARGMTASDPSFSLSTPLLAAPELPNTHSSASQDAPFALYKSLSSQSTQRAPELGQGHCQNPLGKRLPPEQVFHRPMGCVPAMD